MNAKIYGMVLMAVGIACPFMGAGLLALQF